VDRPEGVQALRLAAKPRHIRGKSKHTVENPLQMRQVRADEAWDGLPAMSGWEEEFPEKLEEFPGAARPTPQQISDAIARVHKARREILPPANEFLDAPIDPRLTDWVTKWEKNRIGHMEWLENVIEEFPINESVNSLVWLVGEVITVFEISAKKYRLEMKSILDEE
jgi:hypothetical protein